MNYRLLSADSIIKLQQTQTSISVIIKLVNERKVPLTEVNHCFLENSIDEVITAMTTIKGELNGSGTHSS